MLSLTSSNADETVRESKTTQEAKEEDFLISYISQTKAFAAAHQYMNEVIKKKVTVQEFQSLVSKIHIDM